MRALRGTLAVAGAVLATAVAAPAVAQADVIVEGPFRDLAGQTIAGDEVYDVTICFADDVAHVGLEEVGGDYIWQYFIPPSLLAARSTICDGWSSEVDTTEMSEGTHTFRGSFNYGVEVSDTWTVTIDRP